MREGLVGSSSRIHVYCILYDSDVNRGESSLAFDKMK